MNREQRISAVIEGARNPATAATVKEKHNGLAELLGVPGDDTTEAGSMLALADRFPDDPTFQRAAVSDVLREYQDQMAAVEDHATFPWLDYVLCRWAATGVSSDLNELARIAKHRDGSSACIEVGSEALEALRGASDQLPELASLFAAAGLDIYGPIDFGFLPHGSADADRATRPLARPPAPRPPLDQEDAAAIPEDVSGAAAADVETIIDAFVPGVTGADIVRNDRGFMVFGRQVTIKQAWQLAGALTDLVTMALLPGPGFRWDDVGNDSALWFADGSAPDLECAKVTRVEKDGVEVDAVFVSYIATVYGFGTPDGGAVVAVGVTDMADAKAAAAGYIRSQQGE